MRVNTSILEAQGARLIKNKCQTNLLTRGVFSFTTDLLSLEVFNPLLPQFEMKKTNRKKPQKTKKEISWADRFPRVLGEVPSELCSGKRSGLQGRGVVYLPLKVYLEDLLESDKPRALGQASTSAVMLANAFTVQKGSRRLGRKCTLSGLHPNVASGLVTFGWDVWKKQCCYRLLLKKKN